LNYTKIYDINFLPEKEKHMKKGKRSVVFFVFVAVVVAFSMIMAMVAPVSSAQAAKPSKTPPPTEVTPPPTQVTPCHGNHCGDDDEDKPPKPTDPPTVEPTEPPTVEPTDVPELPAVVAVTVTEVKPNHDVDCRWAWLQIFGITVGKDPSEKHRDGQSCEHTQWFGNNWVNDKHVNPDRKGNKD
jgi:hypothetical protein